MTDANSGVSRRAFLFGSAGAAAAGAAGAAAAQEGNTTAAGNNSTATATPSAGNASAGNASAGNATGGNESGGNATGENATAGNASAGNASAGNASAGNESSGGSSGGMSKTVEVGAGDSGLKFAPQEVEVTPGSTITWTWLNGGHNIVVDSQPEGANWEGTPGGSGKLYDEGYEYTHTFETEGSYEYNCAPHKSAGMVGTVSVSEDAGSSGGGGAAVAGPPEVPDSAKSLGVASTFLMFATLGLSYVFLKFGGDYGTAE